MNKYDKIYVAGHKGFVGTSVVKKLLEKGYKNIVYRSRDELNLFDINQVIEFFKAEKPKYVIVCAAKVGGILANIEKPVEFLFDNLLIIHNILKTAHEYNVKKLILLGTSCAYPKEAIQPIKEECILTGALEPTNEGYALAKLVGLKACEFYRQEYGSDFITIIPSNLYGPNDNFDLKTSHVMAALIRRIYEAKKSKAKSVVILGTGKPYREFTFIDDIADAVVFVLEENIDCSYINAGSGEDITIKDLAYKIKSIIGYGGELIFDHSKPDGMFRKLMDVSKINSFGWKSKISLNDGIEMTYKWYVESEEIL